MYFLNKDNQSSNIVRPTLKVFDVYRGPQVGEGMTSIAVMVIFGEDTRSLQESEAEEVSKRIVEAWRKEAGAELRG